MNIAFVPSSKIYLENRLFSNENERDNVCEPFMFFKKYFEGKNSIVNTYDQYTNLSEINLVIVYRFEKNISLLFNIIRRNPLVKIIFVLTESSNVTPLYTKDILKSPLFDIILTFRDNMIDNSYFYKYHFPNPLRKMLVPALFTEKKYITIINSYKYHKEYRKGDLYAERIKAVRYFAKNSSIDLYGMGWENCNDPLIKKVYLGVIKSKIEVIKNYKFAIVFENSNNDCGGISEKIFDAMAAGCVPIYWGAPNVLDYIPENTFINFRNFSSYQELDIYLKKINESEYNKYIEAINNFLKTDKYYKFTSKGFVDCISTVINKIVKSPVNKKSIFKIKWFFIKKIIANIYIFWKYYKRFVYEVVFKIG